MDYEWFTANERLTRFSKYREQIVGRVKVSESPSLKGPQYSGEDIVVRDKVPSSTEMPSVREPVTDGKHAPIGQGNN